MKEEDPGALFHALAGALIILLFALGFFRELAQHDWPLTLHQWTEALAWPAGGVIAFFFLLPLVRNVLSSKIGGMVVANFLRNYKTTLAGVGVLLVLLGRMLQGDFQFSGEEVAMAIVGLGFLVAGDGK